MAYQALYRKYRPTVFSDVVGQEHITEILKQEIARGMLSHAYLFTGTRGTGKTTCAKILAKAINCTAAVEGNPCGECEMCRSFAEDELTDIVEIDAASNNGVDNIREIRDRIAFPPTAAKYRVYIIDEVHMLSQGAFNALLKTLEEPPEYVVFILATTEVHKLPTTILSRCQRFDFKRIEPAKICERIFKIAEKEGFKITDEAANLIASVADGGMRDALSVLDLCASAGNDITEETVEKSCAMAGSEYLFKIADLIKLKNTDEALCLIDELHNSSVDMQRLLSELTSHFRNLMIIKAVKGNTKPIVCSMAQLKLYEAQAKKYDIVEIMDILSVLQATAQRMPTGNRRCEMEMAMIRLTSPEIFTDTKALERRVTELEKALKSSGGAVFTQVITDNTKDEKVEELPETENIAEEEPLEFVAEGEEEEIPLPPEPEDFEEENIPEENAPEESAPLKTETKAAENLPADISPVLNWAEVLAKLKKTCPPIAGVLGGSAAYIKGEYLLIDTDNGMFRSMVNGSNSIYRDQIRKAAHEILGKSYKLGPFRAPKNDESDPLVAFSEKLKNFEVN